MTYHGCLETNSVFRIPVTTDWNLGKHCAFSQILLTERNTVSKNSCYEKMRRLSSNSSHVQLCLPIVSINHKTHVRVYIVSDALMGGLWPDIEFKHTLTINAAHAKPILTIG